jgi:Ca2+-binding RTX toxin-like protein
VGGAGNDTLTLAGSTTLTVANHISGIETITLGSQTPALGATGYSYNIAVDNDNDPVSGADLTTVLTVDGSALSSDVDTDPAVLAGETLIFNASSVTDFPVSVTGGSANDTLTGGGLADTLVGGAGSDIVSGGDSNDKLYGSSGFDVLYGGNGADTLEGGDDGDVLFGDAGSDVLLGGNGNDYLVGGSGDDTLTGGAGSDLFLFTSDAISDSTGATPDSITDFVSGVDKIRVVIPAADQNFDVSGFASVTSFADGIVSLVVPLQKGDAFYSTAEGKLYVDVNGDGSVNQGVDYVISTASVAAGDLGFEVTGGGSANSLVGGAGDDYLSGAGGNDTLTGGVGNDSLVGGADDDTFNVTFGTDTIGDLGTGNDVLNVSNGATANASVAISWAATAATSNNGAVFISLSNMATSVDLSLATGSSGFTVYGGNGSANVIGSANDDSVYGWLGDDTYAGGAGDDTLAGSVGDDSLSGGADDDIVDGGADDDTLTGGTGVDVLIGGSGTDTFVFANGDSGATEATADIITDFVTGVDSLSLGGPAGSDGVNYVEGIATDFATALANANANLATLNTADAGNVQTKLYVFQAVGTDGYLFIDSDADGDVDMVVVLDGVDDLSKISAADIDP